MVALTLSSRLDGALGGKTAKALERAFAMRTVGDLLEHYPRRYARRGELTPIASLPIGEPVTIVAEVRRASERRMQNRRGSLLEVVISDGNGELTLTFFNQAWRMRELVPGRRGVFAGKVGEYLAGIEKLPLNPHPNVFGLHENADIACAQTETQELCDIMLSLQPKVATEKNRSDNSSTERDLLQSIPQAIRRHGRVPTA